ncbi:Tryptophan/tyrosine permease [Gracilaria domingensis]|nr:Tryptophan/tyrosine permease [Gracilaria domingensis]
MFVLSAQNVQRVNNVLVGGVIAAFCAVLSASISDFDITRLSQLHWDMLARGPLVAVLFVSCVYHNVVSNVTMRLEGDRTKIRRTIVIGSAIPLLMFLSYDAAILASNTGAQQLNQVAVALFSTLAIATSFIGFVEGLTELWADVRQTLLKNNKQEGTNAADFVATIAPPTVMAGLWPDAFLKALDAAGTYGIAVLFGALPAAMAWRNRRREETKELGRSLVGGDVVLGALVLPPLVLIAQRVYTVCSTWLAAHGS